MKKEYRKKGTILAEPYDPAIHEKRLRWNGGYITVNDKDTPEVKGAGPYGMVASTPYDPIDSWYICREFFDKNYEEAPGGDTGG